MQIQGRGSAPKDVSIILTDLYWYWTSLLLLFLYIGYKVQETQPPVRLKYIKFELPAAELWAQTPFLFTFTLFIDIFIFPPQGVEAEWGWNQTLPPPPIISTCHNACPAKTHGLPQGQTGHLCWLINLSFIQFSAFGPNVQQIQWLHI